MTKLREAKYVPAQLLLEVRHSSVDLDVVSAFLDCAFVQNVVDLSREGS